MARFAALVMIALLVLLVEEPMLTTSQCGSLSSCLSYLKGEGEVPGKGCCGAVKSTAKAANTREKRQSVCRCARAVVKGTNINGGRLSGLPSKCGVSLGFSVSAGIKCSEIP